MVQPVYSSCKRYQYHQSSAHNQGHEFSAEITGSAFYRRKPRNICMHHGVKNLKMWFSQWKKKEKIVLIYPAHDNRNSSATEGNYPGIVGWMQGQLSHYRKCWGTKSIFEVAPPPRIRRAPSFWQWCKTISILELLHNYDVSNGNPELQTYSAYNHLLSPQIQRLTEENISGLLRLYFNTHYLCIVMWHL